MFVAFLLIWFVFNEKVTLEILLFGIGVSAAVYAFCCFFMDFSFRKDLRLMRKLGLILAYAATLLWEIICSNIAVLKVLFHPRKKPHPVIVSFRTTLKTPIARVLLANSITLTPGTITVTLEEDVYRIHCLDESFADGLGGGRILRILERLEA